MATGARNSDAERVGEGAEEAEDQLKCGLTRPLQNTSPSMDGADVGRATRRLQHGNLLGTLEGVLGR